MRESKRLSRYGRLLVLVLIGGAGLVLTTCEQDTRLVLRLSTWSNPTELEIMERCIKAFEERYPQVRVVHESYPSGYLDKILTLLAGGTPPDVMLIDSVHVPTFIESGVLIDLAPYAERVELDLSKFYPEVLKIAEKDGKLYAFPKDFTPMVYFYNKQLFDRTGTPYPQPDWTWDDFLETCIRLTGDDNGDGRLDRFGTNLHREFFRWQPWVWTAGTDCFSPDGTDAVGWFDSPESVKAYRFLTDLVSKYHVTPRYEALKSLSSDYDRPQKMFYSGKIGLMPSGHWWIPQLQKYMKKEWMSVGIAPFPRISREIEPVTVMFESGWAVPTASSHRKWAVRLAAFMADEVSQRIRAESGLAIPAMPEVAEEFAARDTTGLVRAFLDEVPYCRQPWGSRISKFTKVEDVAQEIFDRILINGEPAEEAARAVARKLEEVLPDGK
jgi:multiple sugar transport system substrate-binding protein